MIYSICSMLLLIGALGLLAQTLLGGAHISHAHAHPIGHSHANGSHHTNATQTRGPSQWWTLLSPLTFFSLCLGVGATGLLLKHLHLAVWLAALLALLGGTVFYGLLIRPMLSVIFRFESQPSGALEGTLAREAEALTSFDSTGKGLVQLNVDGQIVRVLATLEPEDRLDSPPVRRGDRLTVTRVDGHTNSCRVTRL